MSARWSATPGSEPAEFDPQVAIHVLRMHKAAVKGGPGRRRGGLYARREPTIEEVRESIMRKIDAIERAEARGGCARKL